MDNIVNIKRKAQKLVQQGSYAQAVEQYTLIVESGEMDPYDYVVLGDLLLRDSMRDEAITRYQQALESYQQGGLNRNAIALAKRIRRLAPEARDVLRRLGDLYAAEGLNSEAALHYLEFLETDGDDPSFVEAAEDVCRRLLHFQLPSFELVPRIVSICQNLGQASSLAPGVMFQAARAREGAQTRVEETLTALALTLDPRVSAVPGGETASGPGFMDSGAVTLSESPASDGPVPVKFEADAGEYGAVTLDETSVSNATGPLELDADPGEYGAVHFDEEDEVSESRVVEEPAASAPVFDLDSGDLSLESASGGSNGDGEDIKTSSGLELDYGSRKNVPGEPGPDSEPAVVEDVPASPPEVEGDPDEFRAKGDRSLSKGDSVLAQREYVRAAKAFFRDGRAREAEEVYLQVVKLDPNHLDALRGLVEIAHTNGETEKMARYGCELGDVLLAREKYADAKMQFERVLAFDPEHQKAQSRVKRLVGMMGGSPSYQGLEPMAREIEGSKVTIRDDEPSAPTQTALDLAAILDEFRAAVVGSIPETDSQSHYDMGMAYLEMGLVSEATEEFETAAENPAMRARALEVLGDAYRQAERFEDARRVLEEILAESENDTTRARIHLAVGKVYQDESRWADAEESFFQALELNEELVEAADLLNAMHQRRAKEA